ncbi:RagB/SusD family nutrient uptake outer membrane protein [Dyadobacter sp. CY343]|uniref:RagB/SusD family nutrient uptake outer membrane protein n=1 Tax=Dyadobacter sp. CY343 TaxID=2907299 RepID=UPI001F3D5D45|nr:RagB/SusD family nutrient uptake outer membrane protein [Dyadobacter sp. CY343]MCE7062275.1 RagB/SusD family nutrient uptake outer membrane protein [Dyadobacter sp. CY343]
MKIKFTYMLAAAIGLSSCSDEFLDLAPPTTLSSATYFKTEEHFNQALNSAYERTRQIATSGIFMDEMRSDNTFFTYYPGDRGPYLSTEVLSQFLDDQNTGSYVSARYDACYSGISRVNTIVSRIDDIELSPESRNRILGEAYFLRAFYYFDLVKNFGGVPLHLSEVSAEGEAFLPRNSVEEVYAQIIEDLSVAIPLLPVASTFPQSGRATKGAGKMLLACVYMTKPTREYAKAEVELTDITKMNYSLLPTYAAVFNPNNKNNSESIFEVQYQEGDAGQQSFFNWRFIPKTSNSEVLMGVRGNNYAGDFSGGWNVPTQEMVNSYETGDTRLEASVAVVEGRMESDLFTTESVKSIVGYKPAAGKTHYYMVKKYLHGPYSREFNTDENWPVYRYSGALLLLAECLVEQGKATQALPHLNAVRRRAGLPALTQATKLNVSNEMRHELAFENHRYQDLIRTGQAIDVLTKKGQQMKALYGFLLPSAFNVTQNRLIFAIPFRELQVNNQLVQNPGY